MTRWLSLLALPALLGLAACGDDDGSGDGPPRYEVELTRTTYGIPHVKADDWGSLGYGFGYAYAQDNFCVLMREVVRANGETLRWFGEEDGSLADDVLYTWINTEDYIRNEFLAKASPELQRVVEGYAAGLNRFLEETGVENLAEGPEGCRGEDWVREVTVLDLGKVYRKLIVRASSGALAPLVLAAEAPTETMALAAPDVNRSQPLDTTALGIPEPEMMGSNAYAVGADASQTGKGILLGNPHFPWTGPLRWYVSHLTVTGDYDVMGASLQGVPLINIGFNEDFAWTHTVSTGQRFTFYELELTPGDPMKYVYDDEVRDIEAVPVTVQVRLQDGSVEDRTETIYTTHYGPIIDLGAVDDLLAGWPTLLGSVFTFRDGNLDNPRALDQFLALGRARSVDDVQAALEIIGLPWVNTIAADRAGNAFYADVSTVPNVTATQLESCADSLLSASITATGLATLNGSRSDCEWGTDSDGPPGLIGFENLPKLANRTYVANANDSYWLSNPDQLLTGFSPLIGQEGVAQSLRTRLTFVQAEDRIAGTDGLGGPGFTVENLQEVMFGNRDLAEELMRNDVLALCDEVADWSAPSCDGEPYSAHPGEAATVCGILRNWDGRYDVDSVGSAVWNEFWRFVRETDGLWVVPFDPMEPVYTPRQLATEDPEVAEAVRCELGRAVDWLVDREVPLDRAWGEHQFRPVGTEAIPIHGGSGRSTFSVISSTFVAGEGYANIVTGNSYMQTVTWDDTACPDAYAILSYSQSTDPASPHYADMTRLYSEEGWHDMPFCDADIEAETLSQETLTNDPAP